MTKRRWPHTNHSTAWVTWPYATLVWCCANTSQPTQPTFSEPPKTRTMKGLLQTPPSGKLGLDWFLRGIEVGWYQGAMSHESCFCWCCLVCCTYHTCKRSTHIWKCIETCIIELCVGIHQVAKARDTPKGPKAKQVLESHAKNQDMNWFGQPYPVKRYWHKYRSRYKSSSECSWLHFDLAT